MLFFFCAATPACVLHPRKQLAPDDVESGPVDRDPVPILRIIKKTFNFLGCAPIIPQCEANGAMSNQGRLDFQACLL